MTLLAAGAAMLVLPGPGIAVILLGLVVLSAEFQWAQRVLTWLRERASHLKDEAQPRMPGADRRPPGDPRPATAPTGPPDASASPDAGRGRTGDHGHQGQGGGGGGHAHGQAGQAAAGRG